MFGLTTARLIFYGIALAAILGLLWQINAWRLNSAKLAITESQLQGELACNEASQCAAKLLESARNADKAVQTALAQAQKENEREQAAQQAKADKEQARHAKLLQQQVKKVAELQQRFEVQLTHDEACRKWLVETVPCVLSF